MLAESLPHLPSRKTLLLIVGGFLLLGLLVYGRSLGNEFVSWDDGMLIYENPAVREISPWSLKRIFTTYDPELYIPLTFITYQIDYAISETNPFMYHVTSLLIHIVNAVLVAWVAWLLLGSAKLRAKPVLSGAEGSYELRAPEARSVAALLCGLLFLLHPLHTEAVAWASGRKDVLSMFFFLASLIGYLYWKDRDDRRWFLWSLVFFILGLMSKVMVITLPIILLLVDDLQGRRWSLRMLIEKVPYGIIAMIFGIIALFGKTTVVASSTLTQKILMACKSAIFYLEKMFVPMKLSVLYPYTKAIEVSSADFYVPAIVVILLLVIACAMRHRIRMITFGILFYFVTVAPTFINFAKGDSADIYFASDRYAYMPSIGIFIAAVFALIAIYDRFFVFRSNQKPRKVARATTWLYGPETSQRANVGVVSLVIPLVFVLAFLSYNQSLVWRDTESLFQNVLAYYPESSHVAHNNLGNMYRLRGDLDQSIDEYQKAIAIRPHAKTYSNLGAAYRKQGKLHEALSTYEDALEIDPKSAVAHTGLGIIYATIGERGKAEEEYKKAITLDPMEELAYANLGVLYVDQGRIPEAVAMLQKAIALNPSLADVYYNLAIALTKQSDTDGAIDAYKTVLHIAPATIPARINLGLLLYETGDVRAARTQFETILQIDPQNRTARSALEQIGAE